MGSAEVTGEEPFLAKGGKAMTAETEYDAPSDRGVSEATMHSTGDVSVRSLRLKLETHLWHLPEYSHE